jgi:ATP-binding protein involved in chromosome partitioning
LPTLSIKKQWSDNLDILIIDMPPGTGDIHLSISQTIQVSGAIIVSTPQKVALADAKKGVKMFEKVQIPVFGLVENMAAFSCPKCNEVTHIFGQKSDLIEGIPTLGSVPLEAEIMRSSDNGAPIFITNPDSNAAKIYKNIAEQILNAM